jgi:hypothetical protein
MAVAAASGRQRGVGERDPIRGKASIMSDRLAIENNADAKRRAEGNLLFYGRVHVFGRKSRWHDAKLEQWPAWLILIILGFSSFLATVLGGLVKAGADAIVLSIQREHHYRLHDAVVCWP